MEKSTANHAAGKSSSFASALYLFYHLRRLLRAVQFNLHAPHRRRHREHSVVEVQVPISVEKTVIFLVIHFQFQFSRHNQKPFFRLRLLRVKPSETDRNKCYSGLPDPIPQPLNSVFKKHNANLASFSDPCISILILV